MFKYLDVKEEEDSLLPSRLCAAGLEVPKEAHRSKIPFGVATFYTPSMFPEKDYRRDNPLESSRPCYPWLPSLLGYPLG